MNSLTLYMGLVPLAALTILIAGSFAAFTGHWLMLSPDQRREKASGERGFFVAYFYTLIGPACRALTFAGITPNAVTLGSLVLGTVGAFALASGHFMTAAWLIVCASSADAMDGYLARAQDNGSVAGAFLDSFVDRLTEGVFFVGFALLGDGGLLTFIAMAALIASYAVSYARARGEALGIDAKIGVMQRPVRLVIVAFAIFSLAWGQILQGPWPDLAMTFTTGALAILAVGASISAFRRAFFIYDELLPPEADVETIRPTPSADERLKKVDG